MPPKRRASPASSDGDSIAQCPNDDDNDTTNREGEISLSGRPKKERRERKSLIESVSPQQPIFFSSKGGFSQRRRVLPGRRIIAVPSSTSTTTSSPTAVPAAPLHRPSYYNSSSLDASNCEFSSTQEVKGSNNTVNTRRRRGHHDGVGGSTNSAYFHVGGAGNDRDNGSGYRSDYQLQQQQHVSIKTHGYLHPTTNRTVRRVQMASKRAALASKRKIWDSNDASIDAAQSAVDRWETSYRTFRSFLINTTHSAKQVYDATKTATQKIEHRFFVPIRDIILLPTIHTLEQTVDTTVGFIQSPQAKQLAYRSIQLVEQTPMIGSTILAPSILTSFAVLSKTWDIIQYPIPSRDNVRWSVDSLLTSTKGFLSCMSREIYFYTKLVDATVTRTLSHTQWRVLGSGPYSTLNAEHKEEVIHHLCQRYFSLRDDRIARYELAAHIKFHNSSLYHDLVVSGLLLERGGDWTIHDSWLKTSPDYRFVKENISDSDGEDDDVLLMRQQSSQYTKQTATYSIKPLWFYHPSLNGKKAKKENAWECFDANEQHKIEEKYLVFTHHRNDVSPIQENYDTTLDTLEEKRKALPTMFEYVDYNTRSFDDNNQISHWYEPNINDDVLIDEERHAISFLPHCPTCKAIHHSSTATTVVPPFKPIDPLSLYGLFCRVCCQDTTLRHVVDAYSSKRPLLFPFTMLMRPTLWRFYGEGNRVRRGVWLMDTKRGLQPYSEESAAILEDAYLFLKWTESRAERGNSTCLTVQVIGPDSDESQLVQFRSLTQITAIQKTIAGGLSLFKRRVYRGAQGYRHENDLQQNASMKSHELLAAPLSLQKPSTYLQNKNISNHERADHLILVVHGIGEMLRNSDVFGLSLPPMTSTINECCSSLRKNHAEVLAANKSSTSSENSALGRVEYLPIEWHESFALKSRSSSGSEKGKHFATLEDITLNTIPSMREFANDTMFDILFFMSPKHHEIMIDIVGNEMNVVVQKFRALTGFNGQISLLAHSLGSVISWDILANQRSETDLPQHPPLPLSNLKSFSKSEQVEKMSSPYPHLQFKVSNTFMIGSPVAVFLMLRNQHEPLQEDYSLPGCNRVFNIFHPYDVVAYRLEPLLHKENANVEPKIITHWQGGFRVQYQTKLLWRKIVDNTMRTQKTVAKAVEARMEGIGLLGTTVDDLMIEEDDELSLLSDDSNFQSINVGNLCGGKRLDYMLQEKEIENATEYLAALAAHGSYWGERDLSLFIARQIYLKENI